jgi:Domain of unknown function (DUF4166)/Saccharopine dehydrogenase NADP binding domain
LKLLVIGGYGTFGGRTIQLLKDEAALTLFVAGRSLSKAQAFLSKFPDAKAKLIPIAFDRQTNIAQQFQTIKPNWVLDASGPFQNYGEDAYAVIEACIAERVHYLDLADGSDFVAGVAAYDEKAKAAGVFVLSGVSSFPVLTAAVVRRLEQGMQKIETIYAGIAPSPYAGVGLNVIKAIAGYAGQATRLKREGQVTTAYPFTESLPFTIAPPGLMPLNNIRFSLVDVPDLTALTELWPQAKTVWMGAGPTPAILHRLLSIFAWFVRWRVLPSLLPLAPIISWVTNTIRWGEHRGGMFVQVKGFNNDRHSCTRQWHLLAEGSDGPLIPCMAVQALVLRALKGATPTTGARAAVRELELNDYEPLFAKCTIYPGFREILDSQNTPAFQRVLGTSWVNLASALQELHSTQGSKVFSGLCHVEGATNPITKLIARVVGFPATGSNLPITVTIDQHFNDQGHSIERWTRSFGKRGFTSELFCGSGRSEHLLCERFGPMNFALALVQKNDGLELILRHWSLFGIPMPQWLGPTTQAFESSDQGHFNFSILLAHRFVGRIVKYEGWLA